MSSCLNHSSLLVDTHQINDTLDIIAKFAAVQLFVQLEVADDSLA